MPCHPIAFGLSDVLADFFGFFATVSIALLTIFNTFKITDRSMQNENGSLSENSHRKRHLWMEIK
jgi:hypothetical protein